MFVTGRIFNEITIKCNKLLTYIHEYYMPQAKFNVQRITSTFHPVKKKNFLKVFKLTFPPPNSFNIVSSW